MELEQDPRMRWLKHFIEEYQICTPDGSEGEEEDIEQYLSEGVEIKQFAAITRHNGGDNGGSPAFNIYPVYDSFDAAVDRATANMDDDCFEEQPTGVVDLQNGIFWKADVKVEWESPEQLK